MLSANEFHFTVREELTLLRSGLARDITRECRGGRRLIQIIDRCSTALGCARVDGDANKPLPRRCTPDRQVDRYRYLTIAHDSLPSAGSRLQAACQGSTADCTNRCVPQQDPLCQYKAMSELAAEGRRLGDGANVGLAKRARWRMWSVEAARDGPSVRRAPPASLLFPRLGDDELGDDVR